MNTKEWNYFTGQSMAIDLGKGYNEVFVCFVERSGGSRKGDLALEDAGWVRRLFNNVDIKPLYSTAS
jgi:hypothetical protein